MIKKSFVKGPVIIWGPCTLTNLPDGSVIVSCYRTLPWATRVGNKWRNCYHDLHQMDGQIKMAPSWLVML